MTSRQAMKADEVVKGKRTREINSGVELSFRIQRESEDVVQHRNEHFDTVC